MIHACQAYASLSGCRFSLAAFDGIWYNSTTRRHEVDEARAHDSGPLLSAKLRAISMVHSFTDRLRNGEPELRQHLTRAFSMQMTESARNSMIASCKAADFFPPLPAPTGVDDKDCSWDEVGLVSAPVIAQRLFNDELRRAHDARALVRAKTASFVVDFAAEIGVELPQLNSERPDMLLQFQNELNWWIQVAANPVESQPAQTWRQCKDGDELGSKIRAESVAPIAIAMMGVYGLAAYAAAKVSRSYVARESSAGRHVEIMF